jgi:hypothetical protein
MAAKNGKNGDAPVTKKELDEAPSKAMLRSRLAAS